MPDLTPTFYGAVSAGMATAPTGLGPGWEQRGAARRMGLGVGCALNQRGGQGLVLPRLSPVAVSVTVSVAAHCVCLSPHLAPAGRASLGSG